MRRSSPSPEYPPVAGEFETVAKIAQGFSISRFGDGEVKLMEKGVYTRELKPVPRLARELAAIAQRPHRNCLVGIPTMDERGDRYHNWVRSKDRFARHFNAGTGVKYYSALITHPECGSAWMDTREYYEAVVRIWDKKRTIAIVSEPDSKLLRYVQLTHPTPPLHVACPMYGAFAEIEPDGAAGARADAGHRVALGRGHRDGARAPAVRAGAAVGGLGLHRWLPAALARQWAATRERAGIHGRT